MIRRVVPYAVLPLALIACALASAPWLRAFPSAVLAMPLFGAVALSVLTPVLVAGIGVRPLWLTALVDTALWVFYELLVALREPTGYHGLYVGLLHGPSQILSFALPLVSPRTLLVAPVALCWLSGALVGECVARGWHTVLPYLALVATFGLAYAGTARAVTNSADGRRYDTLLAGLLLLTLLLMRAAQAWLGQDEAADAALPLRGLGVGLLLAVVVAATAAGAVQSSSFAGPPRTPTRVPPLDQSRPLTPIAFVAGLRPSDARAAGAELFKVTVDRPSSNYFAIASVDYYDGDSWSFSRTFRPSGGVVPDDPDPSMRSGGAPVVQQYTIEHGPLTTAPWLPFLERPEQVVGVPVDVDSASGMVVPAHPLRVGAAYAVRSLVPPRTFMQLGRSALLGTSADPVDTALPPGLSGPLATLVAALSRETGVSSEQPIAFLQAVVRELRSTAGLAGAPPSPARSATAAASASGAAPAPAPATHTGGTTFADVLASIRGSRSGTPEQFATLTALVARELGVPARLVAGFRVRPRAGAAALPAGTAAVTTADAWTWVEVPIRGLGWVVLDPSPGSYAGQVPPSPSSAVTQSPSPRPSANAQLTHSTNGGHAVAPHSETPHARGLSTSQLLAVALVGAAVVLGVLGAVLLTRKRRRARRRRAAGNPRRRLLGAWQESIDVLVEAGLPDLAAATSAEIAATTGARFGSGPGAEMQRLGAAANVAIFSPTTWIGSDEADAAWQAHAALSRAVRRQLGWRDRVRAGLRYHRSR